jgi:hypothetical protein
VHPELAGPGPEPGHRGSPVNDPDRTVPPVAAAVMQGPSPMRYWMPSTCSTNGALFTMVSARSCSINVNPAPSRTWDGVHRERGDPQQVLQAEPGRRQSGEGGQTLGEVLVITLRSWSPPVRRTGRATGPPTHPRHPATAQSSRAPIRANAIQTHRSAPLSDAAQPEGCGNRFGGQTARSAIGILVPRTEPSPVTVTIPDNLGAEVLRGVWHRAR